MSSLQSNSMGTMTTIGAAAVGTFLGVCSIGLMLKNEKQDRLEQRKRRLIEKQLRKDFAQDAKLNAVALSENTTTLRKQKR